MPPTRITVTIKVEDSNMPAEEITVEVPFVAMARNSIDRVRAQIETDAASSWYYKNFGKLIAPFSKPDEDGESRQEIYDRVVQARKTTATTLGRIIDLLDLVLARVENRIEMEKLKRQKPS